MCKPGCPMEMLMTNAKKTLLTRYNFTKDGYRKRFREIKPETEETPDQFVIRLKNYLPKWLGPSGSSSGDLVDPRPSGSDSQGTVYQPLFLKICCVPARHRTL